MDIQKNPVILALFDKIISRAEELRQELPDKGRDWDSSIRSGQVRCLLMALLEDLPDIVYTILLAEDEESIPFEQALKEIEGTSCHERGDNLQNCCSCPETGCCDNPGGNND
jgi:hypothetical protein